MTTGMQIRRRLILRRLAGGTAVVCTFLAGLDRRAWAASGAASVGAASAGAASAGSASAGVASIGAGSLSGRNIGGQNALDRAGASPVSSGRRGFGRWSPPLIILDPGHGGHDPGAIGASGTLEKEITLGCARALKSKLEASGRYRVELTRTDDRYVLREDRVNIARELGASLFLSMHADKLSDPAVRGASVYTLAKRASDAETAALADRENGGAADLERVPEILASLVARETRAASSRIAHDLVSDLERRLPVLPSPERHANFTVLHSADIPSVLIEMGFLSNPDDEAALNDDAHRSLIAHSMTRAVDMWFSAVTRIEPA